MESKRLRVAHHPLFVHPVPEGHRFPMMKYELIPEQLLREGVLTSEDLFEPPKADEVSILGIHCKDYWQRLSSLELSRKEELATGFRHNAALIERELRIVQGTIQAAEFALESRIGMNVAGGTHHAFTNRGEGFCLLNDMAVAANWLLQNKQVKKILIVDLDVHQGNGTAEIFRENPAVFTFSMHGEKNYPLRKEQSDRDIELADGTGDKAYLDLLKRNLDELLEQESPDFIFYQSGVDVLESDVLGRLAMSIKGCRERDRTVMNLCKEHEIPICISMGGGYSKRLATVVEAHANTFRLARELFF